MNRRNLDPPESPLQPADTSLPGRPQRRVLHRPFRGLQPSPRRVDAQEALTA